MAEFQWWLLIVGLVAGGGLVAVVTMDGRRREEDLADLERRAEATWIAERLSGRAPGVDDRVVGSVLRLHREYLSLPPPDRLVVEDGDGSAFAPPEPDDRSDGDPDGVSDEVRDDRSRRADEDLPPAREEQAPAGEEAHTGPDGEQRRD